MEANFLDYLELIANKCDLTLKDDVYFWWKPFSCALLYPHQETSAFFVRSELGIQSEWPLKLGHFSTEIESVLLAVAISMDLMERYKFVFDYMQGFNCLKYRPLPGLAAFAQCDKEAKFRFIVERAVTLGLTKAEIFHNVMKKVFMRKDEVVLKLLLDLGMHPDLTYCDSWYHTADSGKSLLQQAVYMRWRAGISVLIEWGADVNYCVGDIFDITSFSRYSPLKILMVGTKHRYISPGCDSSENDSLIEGLLVTGGARICEYDWKTFSGGSTDGSVFESSDIEIALPISLLSDLNLEMNFDVVDTAVGAQFPADHIINDIWKRSQVFFGTV